MTDDASPEPARRSRRPRVVLVVTRVLLGVGIGVSVLSVCLLIGVWRDDAKINSRLGLAQAEVTSTSLARTLVRFNTPDGAVHSPTTGVLYPGGLEAGQVVRVEYDAGDPDLVRVAGRGVALAWLPIGTLVLGMWAVIGPVVWWLRRWDRSQSRM